MLNARGYQRGGDFGTIGDGSVVKRSLTADVEAHLRELFPEEG